MADEQYTRCPACRTVFRVTPQQLSMRAGQVRCGHCQTIFNGVAQLLPVIPSNRTDEPEAHDALGPPTMTLRMAQPAATSAPLAASTVASYDQRFAWADRDRRKRRWTALYVAGIPLLVLLLAGQAVYHFRDGIAARWPATAAPLASLCAPFGCKVAPVRDIAGLSIDASDLQADPAHRGLLILTATLRNRAAWPLAYPYLELTLTDSADQPVARRALRPNEYVGGTAALDAGIPSNGELPVKVFIDASATQQAGYRLYLFYP